MPKLSLVLSLIMFLAGCSTAIEYNSVDINSLTGLEKIVLCEETVDAAKAMGDLKNPALYGTKNRRFYYPINPIKAFGMEVQFVGYGVMYLNGPNVTVTANHNDLRNQVEMVVGKTTSCKATMCAWEISENRFILVYPHQENSSMSIVQCVYGII